MNNQKIAFISCVSNEEMYKEMIFYIKNLKIPENYEIELVPVRSAVSMAEGYNAGMKVTDAKYKVYLHQDVFIINKNFLQDMLNVFNSNKKIGLMGAIGVKKLMPDAIWWNYGSLYGAAYDNRKEMLKSNCVDIEGDYETVEVVDGLILMTQYDIPFRQDLFDGWHYYDLSQCIEFKKHGYIVAVPKQKDPWCIHDCGENWDNIAHDYYRKVFLKEYSKGIFPLVSILIPTYNRPDYFRLALESALNQTYINTEIIIGDDGTNNETEKLVSENYLKRYPNIRYYHNEKNLGQFDNDLKLLSMAKGEYVNFLMDDDLFHPQKIEIMMKYFFLYNKENLSLVTSHRKEIDKDGNELSIIGGTGELIKSNKLFPGHALGNFMLQSNNNIIGEPTTVLFKKKFLNEPFGTFCGRQYICNVDQASWLELMKNKNAFFVNETLSYFRWHDDQQLKGLRAILGGATDYSHEVLNAKNKGFLDLTEEFAKAVDSALKYSSIIVSHCRLDELQESDKQIYLENLKYNQALLYWKCGINYKLNSYVLKFKDQNLSDSDLSILICLLEAEFCSKENFSILKNEIEKGLTEERVLNLVKSSKCSEKVLNCIGKVYLSCGKIETTSNLIKASLCYDEKVSSEISRVTDVLKK